MVAGEGVAEAIDWPLPLCPAMQAPPESYAVANCCGLQPYSTAAEPAAGLDWGLTRDVSAAKLSRPIADWTIPASASGSTGSPLLAQHVAPPDDEADRPVRTVSPALQIPSELRI